MGSKLKEKPTIIAEDKDFEEGLLRVCPICKNRSNYNTLFDPEMLYQHLNGSTHTKGELVGTLAEISLCTGDEMSAEMIRNLQNNVI